jgi:acyl dehydratase
VQRGLWFEEFEVGTTYVHRPGRTVTESDNVLFTTLTMNTQALHLDAAWSETSSPFGERLVNSMFTLSTLVGLSVAQLTQGTIIANLGFEKVTFPHPLRHGDTLYAETEILGKRLSSSRPGEGVVQMLHRATDQHGNLVAETLRTTLVKVNPEASSHG